MPNFFVPVTAVLVAGTIVVGTTDRFTIPHQLHLELPVQSPSDYGPPLELVRSLPGTTIGSLAPSFPAGFTFMR